MLVGEKERRRPRHPVPGDGRLEADLQQILSVGEECFSSGELKKLILVKGHGTEPRSTYTEDCGADLQAHRSGDKSLNNGASMVFEVDGVEATATPMDLPTYAQRTLDGVAHDT
ncbi:hypothetical protein THAOC_03471 [Thalassiosira oceanica]|uniref:Uncharacterized protein n=1 Tax=Thalassiosira oceanica TaxID=159749 RepID=K0TCE2_THAOC|nr:hypothetical protein THAOC_03471 [Thalassiosira oceanica]|eukprot:EJK74829.1 hypothetical protein THAOC_03471 [Thalassiosira oceanica]